jgi:hypothetical protein
MMNPLLLIKSVMLKLDKVKVKVKVKRLQRKGAENAKDAEGGYENLIF